MNQKLEIKTKSKNYNIFLTEDIALEISEFLKNNNYSGVFLIVDKNVNDLQNKRVSKIIKVCREHGFPNSTIKNFEIIAKEDLKNIDVVKEIWKAMLEARLDRKTLVINIGGGITCDIGGFAACTFMRGIDFINCPTTLLSMVDASVGGKVGVNFNGLKNIIGSFNQPSAVIIDAKFLDTLPGIEMTSGMAEVIKHGLISSREYVDFVEKNPKNYNEIIMRSCKIKADVVGQDESESGPRKILNFGHTIGHAVEEIYIQKGKEITHGEAVAIGMVIEANISMLIGKLSLDEFKRIKNILKKFNLPIASKLTIQVNEVLSLIIKDKKNVGRQIKWTLLNGIGNAVFDQTVDEKIINESLKILNS